MGLNRIGPLSCGDVRSDWHIISRLPCSRLLTTPANSASYTRKGDLRTMESRVIKEVNPGVLTPPISESKGWTPRSVVQVSPEREPRLQITDGAFPPNSDATCHPPRGLRRSRRRHSALELRYKPAEPVLCGLECDAWTHRTASPIYSNIRAVLGRVWHRARGYRLGGFLPNLQLVAPTLDCADVPDPVRRGG